MESETLKISFFNVTKVLTITKHSNSPLKFQLKTFSPLSFQHQNFLNYCRSLHLSDPVYIASLALSTANLTTSIITHHRFYIVSLPHIFFINYRDIQREKTAFKESSRSGKLATSFVMKLPGISCSFTSPHQSKYSKLVKYD